MSFFRNLFNRFHRQADDPVAPPLLSHTPEPPPTRIHIPLPASLVPAAPPALNPDDCVTFQLRTITDRFPPELKTVLRKQPSEHVQIQIPRAILKPQLATGAVRVSFAQLCAATPAVFLSPDSAPADTMISLPLDIVIRQIAPPRREDQRPPEIPTNIPSIFGKAGAPSPLAQPPRNGAEAWYSPRRAATEPPPQSPPPAPAAAPIPVAQAAPAQVEQKEPTPPPAAPLRIAAESSAPISAPCVAPASAQVPDVPKQSIPTLPTASPSLPAPALAGTFSMPLTSVISALPPALATALDKDNAASAEFRLPLADIDSRMRTGKLVFKWEQLRDACTIPLPGLVPADMDIELPLSTVVPLYLAARKPPEPRKPIEIDARIRDVFAKAPSSPESVARSEAIRQPAAISEPPPAPEPVAATEPTPTPAAPSQPPTPSQIIQQIRALDGVLGAFLGTSDGLLVAADAPDSVEPILAAFPPALFAQVIRFSTMSHLPAPESIDLHLAGSSLHIRKTGNLYLGILTAADHPLPLDAIIQLSNALKPQAP